MKKLLLSFLFIIFFITANAYRIKWGGNVIIDKPVFEDLYITGGNITINAPVYGDLIVAGGTININDTVLNDLLLAGGTVNINGYITDDIRCAGGELNILKNIGGDVVITGGRVTIGKQVKISGGLISSGGEVTVNGIVNGIVKSSAATLTFNGIANNNFDSRCNKLIMNGTVYGTSVLSAREIVVTNNALFYNNIKYWNKKGSLDFRQSIKNGNAVYDESLKIKGDYWYLLGRASMLGLLWYLSTVFIFLILIQYLFTNTLRKAGKTIAVNAARSLLWGFVFFIGMPLVILLLLLTVIGIPVGIIVMFSFVGLVILATIITSLVLANWYNQKFTKNWGFWQTVLASMAVFIILKIISFTPIFGWLLMMVIAFAAFGSILRNIHFKKSNQMVIQ